METRPQDGPDPEQAYRPLPVEVRRSTKRRRTVTARLQEGRLIVMIPGRMSRSEEQRWVAEMQRRFERASGSGEIDLTERARQLARRYDLPAPSTIRWVHNQQSRWGSCTPVEGSIRISARLQRAPTWVLDYVVVHELAHLRIADHSPAFWRLVHRYPRVERARLGFLIGWEVGGADASGLADESDIEREHEPVPAQAPVARARAVASSGSHGRTEAMPDAFAGAKPTPRATGTRSPRDPSSGAVATRRRSPAGDAGQGRLW